MRPRVFGYLRSHGRSGTIAEQRKAVERWYWKYGVEEGLEWESWVVDRHVRRLNFFERWVPFLSYRVKEGERLEIWTDDSGARIWASLDDGRILTA